MAMSLAQSKTKYVASSGIGVAFTGSNTAGNLIVVFTSSSTNATASVTDTQSNTYVALTKFNFTISTRSLNVSYVLSCKGGANTLTVTSAGSDLGWSAYEFNPGAGKFFSALDTSTTFDGSSVGTTTTFTTGNITTTGTDLVILGAADETVTSSTLSNGTINGISSTLGTGNASHLDWQNYWLDLAPQSNKTASMGTNQTSATYGLFLVAFKALAIPQMVAKTNFRTSSTRANSY